ncbi:MAG TPA: NAD(P)H-dependent oxidoreductase [Gammaproteobacteria bacterium]|nr:NAD(P)H-dependent oxidoreductase [Gammaproteobacteria bacterium]
MAEPQAFIAWADHLVMVYPLWLGEMPALLKGFFEQVLRPGFAFPRRGAHPVCAASRRARS